MLLRLQDWEDHQTSTGLQSAKGELLFKQSGDFDSRRSDELIEKAATTDADDPAGSGRDSLVWVRATSGNAFLPYVQVMFDASGSSMQAPELLSAPALLHNTTSQSVNGSAGDLSDTADLVEIDYQNYESKLRASHPAVEDLPDFKKRYTQMAAEQIMKQAGDNTFSHIKEAAANSPAGVQVQEQSGGSLPSAAQVTKVLGDMIERVEGQFHAGSSLHVSPQLWNVMSQSTNSELTWNGWQGINMVVNGALDAGTSANEVCAVYGSLWHGYLFVVRTDFYVEVSMNTEPPIFFARSRFGGGILDGNALSVLRITS